MRPQTIQIFLPDGHPTSIREAEITNRLVKAILIPRNKLAEASKRDMVNYTGVYFLFGSSDETIKPKVYVGEGEDCFNRIKSHNRNKEFWTHCIIVTTKTNEFTKTDSKFLEHHCLIKAEQFGRFNTENDTGSNKPSLPESREYDLLDNFETLKILLATLGYPVFEPKRKKENKKDVFICKGKKAFAEGEITDDGFVVYQGGRCNLDETPTLSNGIRNMRRKLIQDGILKEEKDILIFTTDHIFSSPSAAAATVLARSTNGWVYWINNAGKTLDELKRK